MVSPVSSATAASAINGAYTKVFSTSDAGGFSALRGLKGIDKTRSVPALNPVLDYQSAGKQTQTLLNQFQKNQARGQSLGKESTSFLNGYTKNMNALSSAAKNLTSGSLKEMLYTKDGATTEDTLQNTLGAMQNLVGEYNKSFGMLRENAERGEGVQSQFEKMSDAKGPLNSLRMHGLDVDENGALTLDEEKMADAIKNAGTPRAGLSEQWQEEISGFAQEIENIADEARDTPGVRLVERDIAQMQKNQDPMMQFSTYTRQGSFNLETMGAAGIMMNVAV